MPTYKTALSVDAATVTGLALIDWKSEKALKWKEYSVKDAWFMFDLKFWMENADVLIIEDQYFDKGKCNADSLIKLAAIRGMIEGVWWAAKGYEYEQARILVKANTWQGSLGLKPGAPRAERKAASIKMARMLTGKDVPENAADAINMGLAVIRKKKSMELFRQPQLTVTVK